MDNNIRTGNRNSVQTSADLQDLLRRIDHKGYPAYKDTRGKYRFPRFILSIDHVQGDPFAAPSSVSLIVDGKTAGFPAALYRREGQNSADGIDTNCRYSNVKKTALEDMLLRAAAEEVKKLSFQAKGSGKSGLVQITVPGQEVLKRSALEINEKTGSITVRLSVGFPANGRTINARELEKILFQQLPSLVDKTLLFRSWKTDRLQHAVDLAEDQAFIREQLDRLGLAAFVADGSILPRRSGVSQLPMREGLPFRSPESMRVTMNLPHRGKITGMGIGRGITLIIGGGYHGKSTLLEALELGIYDHRAGDGREYVITDASAMKLRAEDGRSIQKTDISLFIRNLPGGKDTTSFSTENASGSTSQAANTIEAMEMGVRTFLIDEDTSATNFMIRDELMQRVVSGAEEPIIPFIDRVEELYKRWGISTILAAGSCGSYFYKADRIIQMKEYVPVDVTELAKAEAERFRSGQEKSNSDKTGSDDAEASKINNEKSTAADMPVAVNAAATIGRYASEIPGRIIQKDPAFISEQRIKMKVMGLDGFSVNRETIDLRYLEQLVDPEQLQSIALIVKYLKKRSFDGRKTMTSAVDELYEQIQEKGFSAFAEAPLPGNLVIPRKQEVFGALNRARELIRFI